MSAVALVKKSAYDARFGIGGALTGNILVHAGTAIAGVWTPTLFIGMPLMPILFLLFFITMNFLAEREAEKMRNTPGVNEQIYRDKIDAVRLDGRRRAIAEPILMRMRELERQGLFGGNEQVKSRMRLLDKIIDSQKVDNETASVKNDDVINAELNGFYPEPVLPAVEPVVYNPTPTIQELVESAELHQAADKVVSVTRNFDLTIDSYEVRGDDGIIRHYPQIKQATDNGIKLIRNVQSNDEVDRRNRRLAATQRNHKEN